MKRNRIVINFDNLRRTPGKKGSGFLRALLVLAVVLVVLVGGVALGGYFWWRHYQSSPAYSLALLADAAQRNDTATVDSVLDADKVTDDFVSQARQRATGSSALSALWPSQLDSVMASLSPKLKQTVHDEMIKELKRLTEPAAGKPFVLVALAVTRFADIKQENNTAQATVKIKDEQLQLTMQSDGGHWRITAVQDDKLAKLLADAVSLNSPSTATQVQDEVHKQWDTLKKKVK
jgi:uncharacterized membrane protein